MEEALKEIEELKKQIQLLKEQCDEYKNKVIESKSKSDSLFRLVSESISNDSILEDKGSINLHRCSLIPFIEMTNISNGALSFFILLCLSADKDMNVFVNRSRLAEVTRRNRVTITEYLTILENNNFIKKVSDRQYKINTFFVSENKKRDGDYCYYSNSFESFKDSKNETVGDYIEYFKNILEVNEND